MESEELLNTIKFIKRDLVPRLNFLMEHEIDAMAKKATNEQMNMIEKWPFLQLILSSRGLDRDRNDKSQIFLAAQHFFDVIYHEVIRLIEEETMCLEKKLKNNKNCLEDDISYSDLMQIGLRERSFFHDDVRRKIDELKELYIKREFEITNAIENYENEKLAAPKEWFTELKKIKECLYGEHKGLIQMSNLMPIITFENLLCGECEYGE